MYFWRISNFRLTTASCKLHTCTWNSATYVGYVRSTLMYCNQVIILSHVLLIQSQISAGFHIIWSRKCENGLLTRLVCTTVIQITWLAYLNVKDQCKINVCVSLLLLHTNVASDSPRFLCLFFSVGNGLCVYAAVIWSLAGCVSCRLIYCWVLSEHIQTSCLHGAAVMKPWFT